MTDLRASVIDKEMNRIQQYADVWWDPEGPTKILQKMIPAIRIPLMLDGLTEIGLIKKEDRNKPNVLKGIKILGKNLNFKNSILFEYKIAFFYLKL
ncbi:hypothetical protein PVAND_016590 [Polypedilum vanderplanki]|uniref:Uncharacterized protein n=1 Tax=Polypedilum vanderplanki TaxID=319348 RepID=A0A9J6BG82_POLVA|nr:hypothetical protein PVAND_016590 [Polypedilum vanderplanki]